MTHRGIVSLLTHEAPDGGAATLAQALDARVREGELVERLPDGAVRCFACGHRCLVRPGRRGICKVRYNKDGTLFAPAGYVAALQCDPTEKKPFFHVLPGSDTLTFGMLGCDFHCGYCQNWLTSQALRDDAAGVPVRFNLDADSSSAEVRVQWRIQFEGERSGQTDLQWDEDGHLTSGVVTLATFDAKGQPFAPDDVRVLALHEIGHLIGLDHSPDPGDIMYAQPKVRDLSPRDLRTASLLYDLAPGPLRVGG